MLEDQLQRFNIGYRTCSDLLRISFQNIDPESYEGRIILQREEAFGDDPWEGLGYLSCVGLNLIKHPLKTYHLLKK